METATVLCFCLLLGDKTRVKICVTGDFQFGHVINVCFAIHPRVSFISMIAIFESNFLKLILPTSFNFQQISQIMVGQRLLTVIFYQQCL